MDRFELERYILGTFPAISDRPWASDPDSQVFRHSSNRKWFALIMRIPRRRLGMPGDGMLDVVNLKCPPALNGSLRASPGFYPAYHMNKDNWITAALDGTAPDETIKALLDLSYDATAPKRKARMTGTA